MGRRTRTVELAEFPQLPARGLKAVPILGDGKYKNTIENPQRPKNTL